jgi:hypothetical protein
LGAVREQASGWSGVGVGVGAGVGVGVGTGSGFAGGLELPPPQPDASRAKRTTVPRAPRPIRAGDVAKCEMRA